MGQQDNCTQAGILIHKAAVVVQHQQVPKCYWIEVIGLHRNQQAGKAANRPTNALKNITKSFQKFVH